MFALAKRGAGAKLNILELKLQLFKYLSLSRSTPEPQKTRERVFGNPAGDSSLLRGSQGESANIAVLCFDEV